MKRKVGVPVVAQVRRFLDRVIRMHTEIKSTYRKRDKLYVGNNLHQIYNRCLAGKFYVESCAFIRAFNTLQRAINYRFRHKNMSRYVDKVTNDTWSPEITRYLLQSLLPEDSIEQFINYMEGKSTK